MQERVFFLFVFIFLSVFCLAQTPDTVVVYDYVYVTDTIWFEEEFSEHEAILIDRLESLNQNCFIETNATISENPIYCLENQQEPEMKKAGFFTVIFLSIHSFIFAQNEWMLRAGISDRLIEHHVSTINYPLQPGFFFGPEFYHPFQQSKFGFSSGIIFHAIASSYDYKQNKPIDSNLSEFESEYAQDKTDALIKLFNQKLSSGYPELLIPLKLSYQLTNRWRPFLGIEPKIAYNNGWMNNIGITTGTSFSLNRHWQANFEVSQEVKAQKIIASKLQPISLYSSATNFHTVYTRCSIVYKF